MEGLTITTKIFNSYKDFLSREDKSINGVSQKFADTYTDWEAQNETNKGCWNCTNCWYCKDCEDCVGCEDCTGCKYCKYCEDCTGCTNCTNCEYLVNSK